MSGPRPSHLLRRNGTYCVRFRIPADLVPALEITELRRSLGTTDPKLARERCQKATLWFRQLVDRSRMSNPPQRARFELAAQTFFDELKAAIEFSKASAKGSPPLDIGEQSELSQARVDDLTWQLQTGDFDRKVMVRARALAEQAGTQVESLSEEARAMIKNLAARAELEAMRFHLHRLRDPAAAYSEHDDLFGQRLGAAIDAAFEEQVLNVSQGQWVIHIHHDHQADDLGEESNQRNGSVDLAIRTG